MDGFSGVCPLVFLIMSCLPIEVWNGPPKQVKRLEKKAKMVQNIHVLGSLTLLGYLSPCGKHLFSTVRYISENITIVIVSFISLSVLGLTNKY